MVLCLLKKHLNLIKISYKGIMKKVIKGHFLEVDIQYPEELLELLNYLSFLSERIKIEKVEKLVTDLHDKNEYVIHIRSLKQTLNHGLVLKKVHGVIKFNQKAWLKPYVDINTELRKRTKNDFEKYFFKLVNNSVFSKTMGNIRKLRY